MSGIRMDLVNFFIRFESRSFDVFMKGIIEYNLFKCIRIKIIEAYRVRKIVFYVRY